MSDKMHPNGLLRPLDEQLEEFAGRRLIAMPIAGLIAWLIVGIASLVLPPQPLVLTLFVATGSIVYLGLFISKFTGEDFLAKDRPKNTFDRLFYLIILMSVLVYAIAIPFFLQDYTSLPLSIGILSSLMWVPISWLINHWIGIAHALIRTIGIIVVWYMFPDHRFLAISAVIVVLYIAAIIILERRWRALHKQGKVNER